MNRLLRITALAALGIILSGAAVAGLTRRADSFDHARHKGFFPDCTTCHASMGDAGKSAWPSPETCVACHDGKTLRLVDWKPRQGPRATNLKFTHPVHAFALEQCRTCHVESEADSARMDVQRAVVSRCFTCHGYEGAHPTSLPDSSCGTCHIPLSEAKLLSRNTVAAFPKPDSHRAPGFALGGHGKQASVPGQKPSTFTVSASCATCHARNLCLACHVNAPEEPAIQALALDERPAALQGPLPVPDSHQRADWARSHASQARSKSATCATCHTQESCRTCHSGAAPQRVQDLAKAGPGRAPGAQLARTKPTSHTWEFRDRHGPEASANSATCETCHVRESCLACHRPNGASSQTYHPAGFLTRHPSAAYNREANCSDCHNPGQFCQSCHKQAGLVSGGRGLGGRSFHDANTGFSLGHGQAARHNLESCVGCHAERDCARCHSSVGGGFGFSPHGPGFNAERLQKKNPQLCYACHGTAIPGAKP
jgi:hypothetical protein